MLRTYHIIEKGYRDARSELIHYTFEEVKNRFEPDKEDFPEEWEIWNEATDISGLEDFLRYEAAGMEQRFSFAEDEIGSVEEMKRANEYFRKYMK